MNKFKMSSFDRNYKSHLTIKYSKVFFRISGEINLPSEY